MVPGIGHVGRVLGEDPGQRDLGGRCGVLVGVVADQVDERLVGASVLFGEAWERIRVGAGVAVAEGGVGGDGAGQEALAERAERHEADAELVERGDDLVFGFAPPQRVLALQGGDGLDGVGASDRAGARFGESEVADLAGGDEVADGAGDVFDGDVGVDAVLVEEVDVVGAEPPEGVVGDLADAFGAAVGAVGWPAVGEPELGGDDDLVADRFEGLSDEELVAALSVGLGGVEERDPRSWAWRSSAMASSGGIGAPQAESRPMQP